MSASGRHLPLLRQGVTLLAWAAAAAAELAVGMIKAAAVYLLCLLAGADAALALAALAGSALSRVAFGSARR